MLEDRRDACRALKALSRKYRTEVGAQGMNALCQILQNDSGDAEIISYALETLVNVTSPQPLEEEGISTFSYVVPVILDFNVQNYFPEKPAGDEKRYETVGEQFTEIFIKFPDNVGVILSLLDESSFRVRWSAVKLLSNLTMNKLVSLTVCFSRSVIHLIYSSLNVLRPKEVQEIILISPMGVSKLMDLLGENREVIRNDVSFGQLPLSNKK